MLAHEIIVDPFLLCLPNPCNSLEDLEEFIHAIAGWRDFLDRQDSRILLSDSIRIALNDDNEYPHRHRLSQLIHQFGCTIADANTISKVTATILEKTPCLEDYFCISAVLIEESSFSCTPNSILDRLKDNCRKAFKEDLIISAIKDSERVAEDIDSFLIVASGLGRIQMNPLPDTINIKAEIHDIEPSTANAVETPFTISQSFPITFNHDHLIRSLDLWTIWDSASTADSVRSCIDGYVNNLINSGVSYQSIKKFTIGPGFVTSLHKHAAASRRDYAMVTTEACARIILDIPKNPINKFRESPKESAKQVTRKDGALAYRTHLTKKGVALRLMFWELCDGTIEFSNIGKKDELEII